MICWVARTLCSSRLSARVRHSSSPSRAKHKTVSKARPREKRGQSREVGRGCVPECLPPASRLRTLLQARLVPTAFQLSVLAQEEVGKTFRLEEFIFRVRVGERDPDETWGELLADLLSHSRKQFWFTRQEFDRVFPKDSSSSHVYRLMDDALAGRLERRKQDAALVGLTRDHRGKVNPRGRIIRPAVRIGEHHAAEQLTRVSDVLTWLVEGFQRGFLGMDTPGVEECLTRALESELKELWPTSPALRRTLDVWRSQPRIREAL